MFIVLRDHILLGPFLADREDSTDMIELQDVHSEDNNTEGTSPDANQNRNHSGNRAVFN